MLKRLNRSTTSSLQNRPIKVLQFGKGNFLRAFADWMVDVLNERTGFHGAVQIIQAHSAETDKRFQHQDGLYHVVIKGIRNGKALQEIRLISCVAEVISPFTDRIAFLQTAENADLKFVVSNTTEAGIHFDPEDRSIEIPARTFPGNLTAFLHYRYKFFRGDKETSLTLLPCELIERNGEALRRAIDQYISHWDLEAGFKKWVHEETLFCNTLVDRIVPGFPKDDAEKIWQETGYVDELIVAAEPYHLWVIEPLTTSTQAIEKLKSALPLQQAGLRVKFVNDLNPYRSSKVRILNGAHTCMVPIAWLQGLRTVRDAIDHPQTGAFIREMIYQEIIPTLDLPQKELREFAADVIERFQNPFIRHELKSIALNSVSKFQVRVLPSLLDYYEQRRQVPDRISRALAALILFYKGEWRGQPTPVNDTPEALHIFQKSWANNVPETVVREVLSNETLWKTDLTKIAGLSATVERHLNELCNQ